MAGNVALAEVQTPAYGIYANGTLELGVCIFGVCMLLYCTYMTLWDAQSYLQRALRE